MAAEQPASVQIPLAWVGVEELPILFVNQMLGQVDDRGEAVFTFGQMTPPVMVGSPEEQAQQIQHVTYVPVKPVARVALPRERVEELLTVLQTTLENQDRQRQAIAELRERGGQS